MGSVFGTNKHVADLNYDGVVTTKEFDAWKEEQNAKIKKIEEQRSEYVLELKKEIAVLKLENQKLQKERIVLIKKISEIQLTKEESVCVSDAKISDYVEKMFKDSCVNIPYFPDSVEKAIYTNVFKLLLSLLAHTGKENTINFLNHKFNLKVSE